MLDEYAMAQATKDNKYVIHCIFTLAPNDYEEKARTVSTDVLYLGRLLLSLEKISKKSPRETSIKVTLSVRSVSISVPRGLARASDSEKSHWKI